MIDVSIIIVNYNSSQLINDCIESIFEKVRDIYYEIIIVDNNTEDLTETINAYGDNRIHIIQLPENVGFGMANNAGFSIAKGRNIFCLNPDTLLMNNAVKILSDYLDSHPECGACGGNLFDANLQPTLSFRRILPGICWELNELSRFIIERVIYGSNRIFNNSGVPMTVGYITGADLMMPRWIVDITSGFSQDFFMYYEETDLCARIKKQNKVIISVPNAKIKHLEGATFDNPFSIDRFKRCEVGRKIYYLRNCGFLQRIIANIIHQIALYFKAIVTCNRGYLTTL